MSKFKAPEDMNGVMVGGQFFAVGEDGCITVPDEGNYDMLRGIGFVPVNDVPAEQPMSDAE